MGIAFLAVLGVVFLLLRKFFQSRREEQRTEFATSAPRTENPSAFMAASMQGVIQKLREQEKELERLHKIERERAEKTERLSEEVTRNMLAGLHSECHGDHIVFDWRPSKCSDRGLGFRRYAKRWARIRIDELVAECLSTERFFGARK
jgi:hypothetical protein